jgi:hypothetical protein
VGNILGCWDIDKTMNIIPFAEHYFARCKAKERAQDILDSMLTELEKDGASYTKKRAELMERNLIRLFYKQEIAKLQGAPHDCRN